MHFSSLRTISIAILALLGATATAAFDPHVDLPCEEEGICLTSFIWCSADLADCYFPEGAVSLDPRHLVPVAVLSRSTQYEISWKNADPELPVLVEWHFAIENFPAIGSPSDKLESQWSVNVSKSDTSLSFRPDSILRSFPDANPQGLSPAEAIVSISGVSNHIRISQPGSGLDPVSSYQFSVESDWALTAMKNIKTSESDRCARQERKWKLGVGIGVSVGGALLIAAFLFALRRKNTLAAPAKSP